MPMSASSGFQLMDWVVLGGYFALLIGTGVFFSIRARRQKSTEEYFLGGHRMPVWAVAFSILATAQSAATFTGVPEQSYTRDMSYLSANLGGIIAGIVLATVFIPAYYRLRISTPYQLLETRFGPGAKVATSLWYLIGRVFATGARHFIGAYAASEAMFGDTSVKHVAFAVALFTVFGILYTLWGGISSVIWTDVIQVGVYLGAAIIAIAILLHRIPAGLPEIWQALAAPAPGAASKLTIIDPGIHPSQPHLGFDPSAEFTLLTAIFGFSLITLASHGADQDLVQRMLTCKSAAKGSWSVISGVLIGIPAVLLFLVLGLLLWVYYQRPDLMHGVTPAIVPPPSKSVMTFTLHEITGGPAGLMIAGLLAAGPCGLNSSLNSMASTFISDIYRPHRAGRNEEHFVRAGRWATIAAGTIVGIFAILCTLWYDPAHSTLLTFALGIMSFAYSGLLAVFLVALFTRRGSTRSAIAAMIVGFCVVFLLQPAIIGGIAVWCDKAGANKEGFFASLLGIPGTIAGLKLAFPWQLFIGVTISFFVCVLGSRSKPPRADAAILLRTLG